MLIGQKAYFLVSSPISPTFYTQYQTTQCQPHTPIYFYILFIFSSFSNTISSIPGIVYFTLQPGLRISSRVNLSIKSCQRCQFVPP